MANDRRVRMDVMGYVLIGCAVLCSSDAAPVGNTTVATTSTTTTTDSTDKGTYDDYGSQHYYNHDGDNHYGNHYDNHYGNHYDHHGHHYGTDYGHNNYDHHGEDMFGHVETNLTKDPSHAHIMNEYLNYGFSQHGHDNKTEGLLGKITKYLRNDAATTLIMTSTSMTLLCLAVGMVLDWEYYNSCYRQTVKICSLENSTEFNTAMNKKRDNCMSQCETTLWQKGDNDTEAADDEGVDDDTFNWLDLLGNSGMCLKGGYLVALVTVTTKWI
ncbi:uncharacterized protein [Haliotis asinina]|uniref:uncharacterized protein n=1 Tax=Haliotis asinina TaxID=109174 RepID=UPI0035323692